MGFGSGGDQVKQEADVVLVAGSRLGIVAGVGGPHRPDVADGAPTDFPQPNAAKCMAERIGPPRWQRGLRRGGTASTGPCRPATA